MTLSDPQTRDLIADGLASLVRTNFHQVDVVAGTATAGIAHAALAADRLGAPMAYVRSAPKDHGRGNQIEGRIPAHSKVIMVEDLISTGGSVLKAAQAVEREGSTVVASSLSSPTSWRRDTAPLRRRECRCIPCRIIRS
ncbi:orotate phosphoribosyltransferase [Cutibacterium acnes JCM 18916]|nr:orotate phosphoribosyltransferase [Cutibacterium acnes JCM 18916]